MDAYWARIWEAAGEAKVQPGSWKCRKVKARVTPEYWSSHPEVEAEDIFGNELVDRLAALGAEMHAVKPEHVNRVSRYTERAEMLLK
eukprot:8808385-Lingulodinium_polyedra.AAC.1